MNSHLIESEQIQGLRRATHVAYVQWLRVHPSKNDDFEHGRFVGYRDAMIKLGLYSWEQNTRDVDKLREAVNDVWRGLRGIHHTDNAVAMYCVYLAGLCSRQDVIDAVAEFNKNSYTTYRYRLDTKTMQLEVMIDEL